MISVELMEVIHADERLVVTAARGGGRRRGSDAEVRNDFFHVWTFRDGRSLMALAQENDLEAAGLSE